MPLSLQLFCLLAGGLAAGVGAGPAAVRWAQSLAAVAAAAALLAHAGGLGWLRRALSALALSAVAVVYGHAAVAAAERPPLRRWIEARLGGIASAGEEWNRLDEPLTLDGRLAGDATPGESGVGLLLAVSHVSMGGAFEEAAGGVSLAVGGELAPERAGEWRAGRVVRVSALLRRPARYLNAGVADGERSVALRGIALVGTVKSAALVEVQRRGPWWDERAAAIRAHVRAAIARHVAPHAPVSAAVATAILIGDRAALTTETERLLQEAGTYHVLAISGGNIALLAAAILGVLWAAGVRFRSGAVVAALVLVAHAWVIGGGASVVRATVMAVLYLGLRALDLRTAPPNAVAIAATAMLLADPLEIAGAGFWLTFLATSALIACGHAPYRGGTARRAAAAIVLASVAVEIALVPITAQVFQRVTVAGLVLNLIAIPAMAVVQFSASAVVLAEAIGWTGAAGAASLAAHLGVSGLIESARLVDVAPWTTWRVPPPGWPAIAVYYGALAVALWLRFAAPRPGAHRALRRLATGLAAGLWVWMATAPHTLVRASGDGRLHVTMMDVGQGEALLLTLPNGRTALVDAGGPARGDFDIGDRVIAPALRARGLRRLDYLALTHADPDHVGGAASLLRDFEPVEVWAGVPVANHEPSIRLQAAARDVRAVWRELQRGDRLEAGGVEVRVHHPPPPDWERQRVRNDDSLVFELRLGQVSVLLTGDIGAGVERLLAPGLEPLPLAVLKAPHHGSATSSSASFVDALAPRVVLVSAGRGNPYGHPAPAVLDRYASAGAEVFRTDRDGQIDLVTDGTTVTVTTYTGRMWHAP
jgi:competence protein ComEC